MIGWKKRTSFIGQSSETFKNLKMNPSKKDKFRPKNITLDPIETQPKEEEGGV